MCIHTRGWVSLGSGFVEVFRRRSRISLGQLDIKDRSDQLIVQKQGEEACAKMLRPKGLRLFATTLEQLPGGLEQNFDTKKIDLRVINSGWDAEESAGKPGSGQILEKIRMKL